MKKKIIWLVVSSLVVLALLAASCGGGKEKEAAPVAKEEAAPVVKKEAAPVVKEEAAPAVKEAAPAEGAETVKVTLTKIDGTPVEKLVEKPKYGGELTYTYLLSVLGFDEAYQPPWMTAANLTPSNENLIMADWRRGPAGTDEFTMYYHDFFTVENMVGQLAESFELPDAETIIFHIRPGVKWQNKPPVNGREFTADDAVFNLKRIYFEIETSTMYGMAGDSRPTDVYATDKYTVVVKAPPGMLGKTLENTGGLVKMVPPEVVEKYGDMNDWENVVGTGAFILTDYVPMSSVTWVRNPNYWGTDPILGKDYPLPYVDNLKFLMISDASTRLAALRTGKIEADFGTWPRDDAQPLIKSNPEMRYLRQEPTGCSPLGFRVDKTELPFDDIRVRRALMMGINRQEIVDTFFSGDAAPLTYKIPPTKEYVANKWFTPIEEMPESTRELYDFKPENVEKAKQLLAEAGYPDGFQTAVVTTNALPDLMDQGLIAKEYWAKIGVDLTLDIKEYGTHQSIYQKKTHAEALWWGRGGNVTEMYLCRKGNMYNWAMIDDPKIDEYYYPQVTAAYFDDPKRDKLMKEMNLYVLSQAWYYTPPAPYIYLFWQPWLKNYGGEGSLGPYVQLNFLPYLWVDQELKKEMGR